MQVFLNTDYLLISWKRTRLFCRLFKTDDSVDKAESTEICLGLHKLVLQTHGHCTFNIVLRSLSLMTKIS